MSTQMSFFEPPRRHDGVTLKASFHVPVPIPGPASSAAQEIKRGEGKAKGIKAGILNLFDLVPRWTCGQAWQAFQAAGYKNPPHSIKPRFTELRDEGTIRMLDERVMGPFGEPEHLWELVPAKEGV